jgi:Zn-dependent alcohol dehydrogenase
MQGAVLYGPRDARFEEREEPKIVSPTDAVIRLSATCICGSDLWPYRGIQPIAQPTPMGHEYCGIVEEVGKEVKKIKPGRFVVGSFATSDNSGAICQHGYQSSCVQREFMSTALQLTKRSHNLPTEWQARVESMNGHRGIGFLAMDCEKACGIVGSFLDQEDPTRAHLISMWTAPSHRQQGIWSVPGKGGTRVGT